ncbi:unnamed protein product [Symbiodinium sp. CCMP2592]|nr:unnamed protein product [Symbiodinium sp. CCMP2592]
MAAECPLPSDVYTEALENHLLLACLASLFYSQDGHFLPPGYSMLCRNDILQEAKRLLAADRYSDFLHYSMALSETLPSYPNAILPEATPLSGTGHSAAESHAFNILAAGNASIWEAVRCVIRQLCFEKPRHRSMVNQQGAKSFTVGIFARHQLVGLSKATLVHPNVCKLLCSYIAHLCPGFCWTTLVVHCNYATPVHRDPANGPFSNLLTMISTTDSGGLWMQDSTGSDFQELPDGMCVGRYLQLQDQYVIFPAHNHWHATQTWGRYDRYTLVAYTVRNWTHLPAAMQCTLQSLGFQLPEDPRAITSLHTGQRAFPTILIDPVA